MNKMSKVGLASAAVLSSTLAGALMPAFAGTGGSNNAGIVYGQDAAYCDASGATLVKTDANSGLPLNGAVFSITNTESNPVGVVTSSTAAPDIATLRVTWQNTLDTALDKAFTADTLGANWLKASIQYSETTKASVASDTDPTTYQLASSATVVYPADITALTDANSQSAAMASWPTMAAASDGSTATVTDFAIQAKTVLDREGAVLYTNYDPSNPNGTFTENPALVGSDSEASVQAEFNKALAEYNLLMDTLKNAGYPNASITGTPDTTYTVSFGTFDATSQNWNNFVSDYQNLVKAGNFSFGLTPPTYDVIAKELGNAAVQTAESQANAAIGATTVQAGSDTSVSTGTSGKAYYAVFERSLTPSGGSIDKTCSDLGLSVTETQAPNGYSISNGSAVAITPSNTEGATGTYNWTDTLNVNGDPTQTATSPQFESGR